MLNIGVKVALHNTITNHKTTSQLKQIIQLINKTVKHITP